MNKGIRLLAFLMTLLLLLPLVAACKKEGGDTTGSTLEVKWYLGMVASDAYTQPEQLIQGKEEYSYTDLITLPKAGMKITFTDDISDKGVDTKYAKNEAYVISRWVEKDGQWILDPSGHHFAGSANEKSHISVMTEGQSVVYTYISSYDNEVIRLCYRSGQEEEGKKFSHAKVYMEETDQPGTIFSSLGNQVAAFLSTAKNDCWYQELEGITMYAMGDSYFGGSENGIQYVWPNLMSLKYNIEFKNYGMGGTTISNYNSNSMCNRINQMAKGTPDIVLLEGGRNDFNKNMPLGDTTSTDKNTFCGGINNCIDQLQARYPNALIIGVTCWALDNAKPNEVGSVQNEYAQAMLAVCAARGVPCFNAADKQASGVDMDSANFRQTYSQKASDVSHLNTAGMILVEPKFEKYIAECYKTFLAK